MNLTILQKYIRIYIVVKYIFLKLRIRRIYLKLFNSYWIRKGFLFIQRKFEPPSSPYWNLLKLTFKMGLTVLSLYCHCIVTVLSLYCHRLPLVVRPCVPWPRYDVFPDKKSRSDWGKSGWPLPAITGDIINPRQLASLAGTGSSQAKIFEDQQPGGKGSFYFVSEGVRLSGKMFAKLFKVQ